MVFSALLTMSDHSSKQSFLFLPRLTHHPHYKRMDNELITFIRSDSFGSATLRLGKQVAESRKKVKESREKVGGIQTG